jgi:hypothetical protein
MTAERKIVQLSARELLYLKNTNFLPPALAQIVGTARPVGGDRYLVDVAPEVAEEFRSTFTNRLANVGFDAAYEPTSEGKMLEELIDAFICDES